jgi:TRAP-type uncharacterized transport system substrate-binding protein
MDLPGSRRPEGAIQRVSTRTRMRIAKLVPRISWRDLATSSAPFLAVLVGVALAALHFLQPAPPTTLTISSGPEGSAFRRAAERYQKILSRNGVHLVVLPSEGSKQNLDRVRAPDGKVDIGFVQGGLVDAEAAEDVVSLGSLFYEPLYIFYRGDAPLQRLSELRGRRLALGPDGSGTRALALALLKANGIEGRDSGRISEQGGAAVAAALLAGRIDAAFLMSDSSASTDIRTLLEASKIRLFDVAQTDAYLRRFRFLSKLELGAGTFDLGANIPRTAITLLAPTVELVARPGLHPALSDLLIEAAREVHGHAGLLHAANEFPAPLEHEFPISDDAARFYKSGKTISYRVMPFWLASLVDRILVVIVPALIVLVPGMRLVPAVYKWRISGRIHRRYAELMALERVSLASATEKELHELRLRLDEIERAVINLKIPPSFASAVYVLREHIGIVRARLGGARPAAAAQAA